VLREALQHAVEWRLLSYNPADTCRPPRPEHRDVAFLTPQQLLVLLDAARPTELFLPILIAGTAGLRRGEVLGLRWQDVDLDRGSLKVTQALSRTNAGSEMKSPKTKKSRRAVSLPPELVDVLKQHKAEQEKLRADLRSAYHDNDLVVATPDGRPRSPNAFTKSFTNLVATLDLPPVTFHGMRHSHATLLLAMKVPMKVASERLGHTSVNITMDLYQHVLPDMDEEAAAKTQAALFGERPYDGDDPAS
jgi:integrase